jgi:hypothetical protein
VYVLQIVICPFVHFLLAIVLSVLLRYTNSDYNFGNFKLFLYNHSQICWFHPFERLNPVGWALVAIKESLQLTGTRQHSKDLERIYN